MTIHKFALADATFERAPDQQADIFVANMLDQRHGGPVTIGFGRYGPDQRLDFTLEVHDTVVVLEGRLTVSTADKSVTAGPGEIVAMQTGDEVTLHAHEDGALTAYVTFPHWQQPNG